MLSGIDVTSERVWFEQDILHIEPGFSIAGPGTWHHEWWEQVAPRTFEQRHETLTPEHAQAILAKLRAG